MNFGPCKCVFLCRRFNELWSPLCVLQILGFIVLGWNLGCVWIQRKIKERLKKERKFVERLVFHRLAALQKVEERKFEVGPTLKTFPH